MVTLGSLVASDNSGETLDVTCTPASGSSIGIRAVNCEAEDSSGNQAICEFNVLTIGK